MKKRALISVSDKTGVTEFAAGLVKNGFEIISTGGTAAALRGAGVDCIDVSEVTGFPECLDGRVKTLHPAISAGILAMRSNPAHMEQMAKLGIEPIDVVCINLYPFKATILKDNVALEEAIENIDIGGPTMIRSAAKNWQDVAVVVDHADYAVVLDELENGGAVSKETKFRLAAKVFEHTSHYDTLISGYLRQQLGGGEMPGLLSVTYELAQDMRYGENPHQKAAYYKEIGKNEGTISGAEQLHGKELSFNNINDTAAAIEALKEFDEPCVVAVKHANPCGVGVGANSFEAYTNAYNANPTSIFGGIVAFNREVDEKSAAEINKIFIEIVIAPSFNPEALAVLSKKKNIRLLKLPTITQKLPASSLEMKKVPGGMLVQEVNSKLYDQAELKVVTKRQPTEDELKQLKFAMKIAKHTKSNAIVLAKGDMSVGIGPGQTDRISATNIALAYAGDRAKGAVMASDAFFPFSDCVEAAAKAGVTAVIHPGGSLNDQLSVDKADELGLAMVVTGLRHFKH